MPFYALSIHAKLFYEYKAQFYFNSCGLSDHRETDKTNTQKLAYFKPTTQKK